MRENSESLGTLGSVSRDVVRRWGFQVRLLRVTHTRLDGRPGDNVLTFTRVWLQCAVRRLDVFSFLFQDMPEFGVLIRVDRYNLLYSREMYSLERGTLQ